MPFGAATIAALRFGAAEIVDVHPIAQGSIGEVLHQYPHIQKALPAMGYSSRQIADLQATVNAASCDLVLFATPIQLAHLLTINKPTLRVRYEYKDHSSPYLEDILLRRIRAQGAF
jgi:predicted GTPase